MRQFRIIGHVNIGTIWQGPVHISDISKVAHFTLAHHFDFNLGETEGLEFHSMSVHSKISISIFNNQLTYCQHNVWRIQLSTDSSTQTGAAANTSISGLAPIVMAMTLKGHEPAFIPSLRVQTRFLFFQQRQISRSSDRDKTSAMGLVTKISKRFGISRWRMG
jgi:hypothetical protein